MKEIVNFLHEIGMLSQIPRSGFAFLGSGQQSVAEHSFRVTLTAYALAKLSNQPVDHYKLLMICLLHDLPESRIGDLNYVQKRYIEPNLNKALEDIQKASPFGPEIVAWIEEYEKGESLEAQLAHDADQLELLLMLKQAHELGNPRAMEWFQNACKRLRTPMAKQIAEDILHTPSDEWWFTNKEDPHWQDGGKKAKHKPNLEPE